MQLNQPHFEIYIPGSKIIKLPDSFLNNLAKATVIHSDFNVSNPKLFHKACLPVKEFPPVFRDIVFFYYNMFNQTTKSV